MGVDLPRYKNSRSGIEVTTSNGRQQISCARAACGQSNTGYSTDPCVPLSRKRRSLLVVTADNSYLTGTADRIKKVGDHPPHEFEHVGDTSRLEITSNKVRSFHLE